MDPETVPELFLMPENFPEVIAIKDLIENLK